MGELQPNDDKSEASIAGLLLSGGKVDPAALRRAWEDSAGEDEGVRLSFCLQRDLQTRLDKYLTNRVGFMSRSRIQRLIDHGLARVNDRPARCATKLRKGDVVEVVIPPPPSKEILAEDIPIDVLYEDEYLLVLNKRPDIIVHPAKSEQSGTLLNALAWHVEHAGGGALSTVGSAFKRPGVVHRLDRKTSGCIVFAKHDETHWAIGEQFSDRTVEKRYLAVIQGRFEPDSDVIDAPIGAHPNRAKGYRERQVVRHDHLGKHAVTICRVRERYLCRSALRADAPRRSDLRADALGGLSVGVEKDGKTQLREQGHRELGHRELGHQDFTLLELELKTGRTHQIRVHLSNRGYPIVGDDMYGGSAFEADGKTIIDRQALHAALLRFTHPATGERMTFTAPVREDMAALIQELRKGEVEVVEQGGVGVDLERAIR